MFCVTFYSYKGGVGRSLALANAAVLLARGGKRVLLVDFDLEAPGIPTLTGFEAAIGKPGVVEYVHQYLSSGSAPDAAGYLHPCIITYDPTPDERYELQIDVMPAGIEDEGYSARFASIDWNDLYGRRNGFLLMEELRASWERAGYDYVLIDSRTGHTDVSGICTRQLPDAVVAVFFPNEQNLSGLTQVVRGVRSSAARPRPIRLTFVASRVPRLDDEHGHLRRWLDRFKEALGYEDGDLTVVEHYDSLMLLNQSLFTLDRPRSGLAQQYEQLVNRLAQLNPEDASGALAVVNAIADARQSAPIARKDRRDEIRERLDAIAAAHAGDGILQYALARAYYRMRMLQDAAKASDNAISHVDRSATGRPVEDSLASSIHRLRIRIFSELESQDDVAASAAAILADSQATRTMIIDALRATAAHSPGAAEAIAETPAIAAAPPGLLLSISQQLSDSPSSARLAGLLAERVLRTNPGMDGALQLAAASSAQLSLIAGGRFQEAVALGESSSHDRKTLPGIFNTAVARWGRDGQPRLDDFGHVLELFAQDPSVDHADANHLQCLALAHAALGEVEAAEIAVRDAHEALRMRMQRNFSCWTYFTVSPREFSQHLDAVVAFARGSGPPPEVFTRAWQGLSE